MSLRRNRSALLQSEAPESGESPSAAVPPPAPRSITLTSRTTCSSGRRTIGFAARRTRRSSSRTSPRRRSRSSAAPTAPNTQVSRNSADNTDATQQTTPYRCTFRAIPELTATPGPGRDPPRPHEQLRHHYRRQALLRHRPLSPPLHDDLHPSPRARSQSLDACDFRLLQSGARLVCDD